MLDYFNAACVGAEQGASRKIPEVVLTLMSESVWFPWAPSRCYELIFRSCYFSQITVLVEFTEGHFEIVEWAPGFEKEATNEEVLVGYS